MQNIDNDLMRISQSIFEKANDERSKMEEDLIKKYKLEKKRKETELLEDAYKRIHETVDAISNESNRQITREKTLSKTKLMTLRNKIIHEVYLKVDEKLRRFIASEEYYGWLLKLIREEIQKSGAGDYIVLINVSDEKYKNDLERDLNQADIHVTVEFEKDNIMGGARIKNKSDHKMVDHAISNRLEQQRHDFSHAKTSRKLFSLFNDILF